MSVRMQSFEVCWFFIFLFFSWGNAVKTFPEADILQAPDNPPK